MRDPRKIFLIHGRDCQATEAFRQFLEALDLHPLDWEEAVGATRAATPFLGHAVRRAFDPVQAAVVPFTPDDVAYLHPDLQEARDPAYETGQAGQARPNVIFEAGMAFALRPRQTLVIEVGDLRPFTDFGGRNVIRFAPTADKLTKIAGRLRRSGCAVDDRGADWLDLTRFDGLAARSRRPPPA